MALQGCLSPHAVIPWGFSGVVWCLSHVLLSDCRVVFYGVDWSRLPVLMVKVHCGLLQGLDYFEQSTGKFKCRGACVYRRFCFSGGVPTSTASGQMIFPGLVS